MTYIDNLNTSSKVARYLRDKGFNIIPIVLGTKTPPKGFNLADYFEKPCDVEIKDADSIALLHGKISDTFAIDIDMKNGGVEGLEIPLKIIKSAISCLNTSGKFLFVTSSLSNYQALIDATKKEGLTAKVFAKKKLFFEELIIIEAKK